MDNQVHIKHKRHQAHVPRTFVGKWICPLLFFFFFSLHVAHVLTNNQKSLRGKIAYNIFRQHFSKAFTRYCLFWTDWHCVQLKLCVAQSELMHCMKSVAVLWKDIHMKFWGSELAKLAFRLNLTRSYEHVQFDYVLV